MAKQDLTVMIVDGGARGHVLADAYARSPNVKKIVVAPGNDYIAHSLKDRVHIVTDSTASLKDPQSILKVAQKHKADLVDVAQDDALALGAVDVLQENGIPTLGPTQKASRLEWDKGWTRQFMARHNIPGPQFKIHTSEESGINEIKATYDENPNALRFIKASGLAAGKGVICATNLEEGIAAVQAMRGFKKAGETYLIEHGMRGREGSDYALTDGTNILPIGSAMDFKRIHTGDKGPNTGGMGAVFPTSVVQGLEGEINDKIVRRAIDGMREEGNPYVGVLYSGIMVREDGSVAVVEYNSRWGDPEVQVIVPGIQTPMDELAFACLEGRLNEIELKTDGKARVCIVGASRGYPGSSEVTGQEIYNINEMLREVPGVQIFGAGVKVDNGRYFAGGGRLFSVVAEGEDLEEAQAKALIAMIPLRIEGSGIIYRTDIGYHDIDRELGVNK